MGNQAAAIGILIHAIEKCINLSFVRSTTGSRYGVLHDPLRDCGPLDLDYALMTSLLIMRRPNSSASIPGGCPGGWGQNNLTGA